MRHQRGHDALFLEFIELIPNPLHHHGTAELILRHLLLIFFFGILQIEYAIALAAGIDASETTLAISAVIEKRRIAARDGLLRIPDIVALETIYTFVASLGFLRRITIHTFL